MKSSLAPAQLRFATYRVIRMWCGNPCMRFIKTVSSRSTYASQVSIVHIVYTIQLLYLQSVNRASRVPSRASTVEKRGGSLRVKRCHTQRVTGAVTGAPIFLKRTPAIYLPRSTSSFPTSYYYLHLPRAAAGMHADGSWSADPCP